MYVHGAETIQGWGLFHSARARKPLREQFKEIRYIAVMIIPTPSLVHRPLPVLTLHAKTGKIKNWEWPGDEVTLPPSLPLSFFSSKFTT